VSSQAVFERRMVEMGSTLGFKSLVPTMCKMALEFLSSGTKLYIPNRGRRLDRLAATCAYLCARREKDVVRISDIAVGRGTLFRHRVLRKRCIGYVGCVSLQARARIPQNDLIKWISLVKRRLGIVLPDADPSDLLCR
jgi:hypothetical protein